ncbi:MAG: hypothetical protein WAO57_12015 [Syntrophomonadaceae bacterium]
MKYLSIEERKQWKTLPTVIVGRVYIIDVVIIIEKYTFHRTNSREGFVVSLDVIDKTQYYVGL